MVRGRPKERQSESATVSELFETRLALNGSSYLMES